MVVGALFVRFSRTILTKSTRYVGPLLWDTPRLRTPHTRRARTCCCAELTSLLARVWERSDVSIEKQRLP
jgi:hypothetical protein